MNPTIWDKNDRYVDRHGKLIAKILHWKHGKVTIEYLPSNGKGKPVVVELPEKFWTSEACGWRLRSTEET